MSKRKIKLKAKVIKTTLRKIALPLANLVSNKKDKALMKKNVSKFIKHLDKATKKELKKRK